MEEEEFEQWISAYMEAQASEGVMDIDHPLFWAVSKLAETATRDPELCWKAIIEILGRDPSDNVKGLLAAGALEDLIEFHGRRMIERIEAEAGQNPAFKDLLKRVLESSTPDIWSRIEKARA
jgi:hypothetical protein